MADPDQRPDASNAAMRVLQRLQAVRPLAADRLAEVGDHLHLTERADYRELLRVTRAKQATLPAK